MEKLDHLVYREDVSLAFDKRNGFEHKLNEMASYMLKRLQEGESLSGLAREISDQYGVDENMVVADIEELVANLAKLNTDSDLSSKEEFHKSTDVIDANCSYPINLELELTKACNWNCSFCYNTWKTPEGKKSCDLEKRPPHLELSRIIALQKEAALNSLLRIRYSGGEPLMHPEIKKIVESGAEEGLYQVIFSNGTLLDKEKADFFSKNNVREMLFSVHGDHESHDKIVRSEGALTEVIRGIEIATQAGIKPIIEITLTSQNVAEAKKVLKIIQELGVKEVRLMRYVPTGRNDEELSLTYNHFQDLLDSIDNAHEFNIGAPCSQKHCFSDDPEPIEEPSQISPARRYLYKHCNAGLRWMAISYDGKMKVCPHSLRSFGNIYEGDSISETWNNNIVPATIKAIQANIREECRNCILSGDCKNGCHLRTLDKS